MEVKNIWKTQFDVSDTVRQCECYFAEFHLPDI